MDLMLINIPISNNVKRSYLILNTFQTEKILERNRNKSLKSSGLTDKKFCKTHPLVLRCHMKANEKKI